MNDANGRPLYLRTTYIADGSPYLYEEYAFAEITSSNGTLYPNVRVKVDLVDKLVIYITESGDEMIATTPIRQVRFHNFISSGVAQGAVVLEGSDGSVNSPGGKIYQVLESGKAKLLKELTVTFSDNKRYGEATVTRVFTRKETYFGLFDGPPGLKKLERNKSSLVDFFPTMKNEVTAYIEAQKLKCKSEEDLIVVFRYYNSI
ncbi:MAG: hypothetical protein H7Y42_11420 [Chitinophagaceae bacterium]|nr:hypothetical protein [Chitinophagaceae bacterium]